METLVVDDSQELIETLGVTAQRNGIGNAEFLSSLGQARSTARKRSFGRFIADYIFEGEDDDGVRFLEDMRSLNPSAELVLLTGKPVSEKVTERLQRIGASYLSKGAFDKDVFGLLVSSSPIPTEAFEGRSDFDVAALRLQFDNLRTQYDDVYELNDLLVSDILEELERVPDRAKQILLIGEKRLSADDLRREVLKRTEIGRQLIRLHHELYRHLRKRR